VYEKLRNSAPLCNVGSGRVVKSLGTDDTVLYFNIAEQLK